MKHQIHEQKEKITRADKNLQNAKKGVHRLYETTGDKTVLIQQVCELSNVLCYYNIYFTNLSWFIYIQ